MVTEEGALITQVDPDGIGAELELVPGDRLLAINGKRLIDQIDYLTLTAEEHLILRVLKSSGDYLELEFDKDAEEQLGLGFDTVVFDGIRTCNNHCLFCFVHQLPAVQRSSLYIQDDDYRLSFLQGSYVTLTNLTEADWKRIIKMHLSPLYISVHATDPAIRRKMLGSKEGGSILKQLKRLADAGINVHTQAVICPGINDGPVLEKTIIELAELWPHVVSLAVVPVGLTGHRQRLFQLRTPNRSEAEEVLETIRRYQSKFLKKFKTRFVFAADEWYIIAREHFPSDEEYEEYPQLDNGVGLIRRFLTELDECLLNVSPSLQVIKDEVVIITGESAIRLWEEVKLKMAKSIPGLKLDILPVTNGFFGPSVTVTGLLSGRDIINAIQNHPQSAGEIYLIPEITLKQGEALFLDGISVSELKKECFPKKVAIVPTRASDWLDWLGSTLILLK